MVHRHYAKVSDVSNLINVGNGKSCHNCREVELQRHTNEELGEEIIFSIEAML